MPDRRIRLGELAEALGCALEGDAETVITHVASLDEASPGAVTLMANPRLLPHLAATRAAAVILAPGAPAPPCAALRADHPYLAFARALALFAPPASPPPGVHPLAAVSPTAQLGRDVSIGAFVAVGERVTIGDGTAILPNSTIGDDVVLGRDCLVHANVSIRERVTIGDRVVLQDGVVVGADGFGFVRRQDGSHEKIPQTARVVIEDDVELGANTTVDRPPIGETRIRAGAKIDNLVQVGHGVTVGRNVLLAAQVGIAGSTRIEDDAVLGGQVGVGDHLTVGRGAMAVGQSGITESVAAGARVAGYPAIDSRAWGRSAVLFRRLPELKRRLEALEAKLLERERPLS